MCTEHVYTSFLLFPKQDSITSHLYNLYIVLSIISNQEVIQNIWEDMLGYVQILGRFIQQT